LTEKDYASLKMEAEDRSMWHATNRREMSEACCTEEETNKKLRLFFCNCCSPVAGKCEAYKWKMTTSERRV